MRSTRAPASGCGATTRRSPRSNGIQGLLRRRQSRRGALQGQGVRRRVRRPADRARCGDRQGRSGSRTRSSTTRRSYTITGAPRVFKGKVIIGNGGAEYGVRGYVTAYDAETGEQKWRWFTVPGDPGEAVRERGDGASAAKTWDPSGKYWEVGGGGTAWDTMAFDPELDLLYIGTGNGSPWGASKRSPAGGDNLYLASIVALKPDTGEYVWHYQETPGDNWDYTVDAADDPGRPHDRRQAAQGDPACAEERLLLRHRPHGRRVHLGEELRRRELGHRLRHQRPADRDRRSRAARSPRDSDPRPVRRAQLAPDVVQPGRPGSSTCRRRTSRST